MTTVARAKLTPRIVGNSRIVPNYLHGGPERYQFTLIKDGEKHSDRLSRLDSQGRVAKEPPKPNIIGRLQYPDLHGKSPCI